MKYSKVRVVTVDGSYVDLSGKTGEAFLKCALSNEIDDKGFAKISDTDTDEIQCIIYWRHITKIFKL